MKATGRSVLMFLLLLPGVPASAQTGMTPVVSVEGENSHFKVAASVVLPVTRCAAYRLLADYRSLPSFIPGMLQVREKRISDRRVNVWQQGEVEVLFFRVKVESSLEIDEMPGRRLAFRQVDGDLESYSGEWNVLQSPDGARVDFIAALALKPEHFAPDFLVRRVLEKEARKRFEAIAKESLKRKNQPAPECVSSNSAQP